jgi:3-hydroxyacyl-CoA dehydrogenase
MIDADDAEVTQSSDSPGFIANAILMPMLNEAILVLEKVRPIALSQETKLTIGNRDSRRY